MCRTWNRCSGMTSRWERLWREYLCQKMSQGSHLSVKSAALLGPSLRRMERPRRTLALSPAGKSSGG